MLPSNTQPYVLCHLSLVLCATALTGATWRGVSGYVVIRKWSRDQAWSIGQSALGLTTFRSEGVA